jgi:hypothetical protein
VKNEERLRALIAEARQRAGDIHEQELSAFQQRVEEALSRELCVILEIAYPDEGTAGRGPQRAVFRVGGHEWALTEGSGMPAWAARITPPLRVDARVTLERIGFDTRDELLLHLDEALQSERR